MDQLTFIIFFIYGLAFFGMGITMALESGRSPALAQARILRPLAAFGLIHGTHEWLESYLLQAEAYGTILPNWLPWLRLGFLIASFTSLFIYGIQTLLESPPEQRKWIYLYGGFGLYFIFILTNAVTAYNQGAFPVIHFVDGLSRYLLAVTASTLAALALFTQGRSENQKGHPNLSLSLNMAAWGFAVYVLTQLFVHPIDMFPARYLNEEAFRAFTGFPIQLVRAIMAILITIGLLRATQVIEEQRKAEYFAAQQARLEALEQRENLRKELLRHTVQAQEDERARIARELHDETSQMLSALSLELATLRALAQGREKMTSTVDKLQELSRQMSQGLYRLVADLRPAQLDDLGLVPALKSLLESQGYPQDLKVTIEVTGKQKRLDPLVEIVLFRVAQEALNNVVRHAGTNEASVRLSYAPQTITLEILDSGAGFDPTESLHPPRGWGIAGMRERVESVDGQFNLDSTPGKGATVEVVIPLP